VLVAGGEMAATAVQTETAKTQATANIPIIMAFGGGIPANAAANTNMTGFVGDCKTIAQNHVKALKQLKYTAGQITVLYDKDGDPPAPGVAPKNKVTNDILGALKAPKGGDPNINAKPIDTANITQNQVAQLLTTSAFMMIPNAVFFEKAATITKAVDSSGVKVAYYPEYYYFTKSDSKKKKANVSGFNVPATYRVAASWVNYILRGTETVQKIVQQMKTQFAEAIPDPYLEPNHPSLQIKDRRRQPKKSSQRKASTKRSGKKEKRSKQPTGRKKQRRPARPK
jgi:hypothetical protein